MIVRAALTQVRWTGDQESMAAAHETFTRLAAGKGAKVVCFQEVFNAPYFPQVEDAAFYSYAEPVPGPTTERFGALAKELGIVIILPVYEVEQPGIDRKSVV